MANPYHDASGKFASKEELQTNIDSALQRGDFTTYATERKNLEEIEAARSGVFTAYNYVPFATYPLYEQYAQLTPGADSINVAWEIHMKSSQVDHATSNLSNEARTAVKNSRLVPYEYSAFAVRNTKGKTFDVYVLDEDSRFVGVVADTTEEEALDKIISLLKLHA
jgi:beta-lactamase class D